MPLFEVLVYDGISAVDLDVFLVLVNAQLHLFQSISLHSLHSCHLLTAVLHLHQIGLASAAEGPTDAGTAELDLAESNRRLAAGAAIGLGGIGSVAD